MTIDCQFTRRFHLKFQFHKLISQPVLVRNPAKPGTDSSTDFQRNDLTFPRRVGRTGAPTSCPQFFRLPAPLTDWIASGRIKKRLAAFRSVSAFPVLRFFANGNKKAPFVLSGKNSGKTVSGASWKTPLAPGKLLLNKRKLIYAELKRSWNWIVWAYYLLIMLKGFPLESFKNIQSNKLTGHN